MRRRPWLAALLSIAMVGLGDVYNGWFGKGVVLALLSLGAGLSWKVLVVRTPGSSTVVLFGGFAAVAGISVFGAIRAFRDARSLGDAALPRRSWQRVVAFTGLALLVAVPLDYLVEGSLVRIWRVPSGSMSPTLEPGDHVLCDQAIYRSHRDSFTARLAGVRAGTGEPAAGDVIVFLWPRDRSKEFVKRVVATEGQTVELRGASLLIDGVPCAEPYARYVGSQQADFGPFRVPAGSVFVLGDNRNQSYDSRFWGPVPVTDVVGRVTSIYWSWGDGSGVRWGRLGRRVE
jgi:signal peptidase I